MATEKRQRILSPAQRLLGEDFNATVFLKIVAKSLIWLVTFTLFCQIAVFLYLRYTYNIYESSTRLIYKRNEATEVMPFMGQQQQTAFNNLEIIRSSIILKPVIQALPLSVAYFEKGRSNLLHTEYYKSTPFRVTASVKNPFIHGTDIFFGFEDATHFYLTYEVEGNEYTLEGLSFGEMVETPHFDAIVTGAERAMEGGKVNPKQYFFRLRSEQEQMNLIADRLTITPYNRGGQILQIDMQDHLPERATDVLNEIGRVYIAYDVQRQQQSADNVLAFIEVQLDTITRQLQVYEEYLKDFRLDRRVNDPQSVTASALSSLSELEQQKVQLLLQVKALDWLRNYVETGQSLRILTPELVDLEYRGYTAYLDKIKELQGELENLRLSLREDHVRIAYVKEQLAAAQQDLFDNLAAMQTKLQLQITFVNEELQKANSAFAGLSELESEFTTLNRIRGNIEKFYLDLLDKQTEFQIVKASIVENFAVLEPASRGQLIAPRRNLLRLGAIGFGLFLWIGLVVMKYLLQSRIQTMQEVEENSVARVLAHIPPYPHHDIREEWMVNRLSKSVVTEAFRALRFQLEFIDNAPGPKVVAVTSTVSGEGKTFVAVNLAGILQMAGKRVLLIDLDMRKPKQHKVFGLDNTKGMSLLLINKLQPADCLHHLDEGFDFISSGPLPADPSELILSERFRNLLAGFKDQYDVIVFDTPPVGIVSDALELLKQADYPLYVVRNDYSRREFLNYPNRLVRDTGISRLGIIVNDMNLKRGGYGRYQYGYTYTRGYYTDEGASGSWWRRLFRK